MRALRQVMGYRNSSPLNVILAETRESPLCTRARYLCQNFLTRTFMLADHPLLSILQDFILYLNTYPRRDRVGSFPLLSCYREVAIYQHMLPRAVRPLCYVYSYEVLFFSPDVDTIRGRSLLRTRDIRDFQELFRDELKSSVCLYTDGSKFPGAPFVGFTLVSLCDAYLRRYKTLSFVSSYGAEAMAVIEALKLVIEKG